MTQKQIIKTLRIIMPIVAVTCLVVFPPWELVWAWLNPLPATIQEEVDDSIGHGFDGIIVYVDEGGKSPAFYSAGWHNRENKIPAIPQALFKIASISKLYDAVAITKLVKDNRLSLDKTLAVYFPELTGRIEHADEITLRMMVGHRSGIPNLTDTPNFWTDPPESSQEALDRVLDLPALFEPGTDYAYSNTNYLLISLLIEKVTGSGKYQFIKDRILTPLGLENTYGALGEINPDSLMSGYYVGVEKDIKTTDYGSMIATAEDVGVFLRALNEACLFGKRGALFDEGEPQIYTSIYKCDHTGLIPGYMSIARYHKDIDAVVVQFINTTDFESDLWTLSEIVYNRIVKILKRKQNS